MTYSLSVKARDDNGVQVAGHLELSTFGGADGGYDLVVQIKENAFKLNVIIKQPVHTWTDIRLAIELLLGATTDTSWNYYFWGRASVAARSCKKDIAEIHLYLATADSKYEILVLTASEPELRSFCVEVLKAVRALEADSYGIEP